MNKELEFRGTLIGVSSTGLRFLIAGDKKLKQFMDGCCFEDNTQSIEQFPTEPGVYSCTIRYWFQQGYADGWKADGESEWDFVPSDIEPLSLC